MKRFAHPNDLNAVSPVEAQAPAAALLGPGDRVVMRAGRDSVYEIVHISQQKAWVRPIRSGSPLIVQMADLSFVAPGARPDRCH